MQKMFLIYLKISALKKGFLKEMEVITIKDILSCEEFAIVLIRSYEIYSFIMGYHIYKTYWTPVVGEKLIGVMESNNLMDKYVVAVKISDESIVGHLPLGKSERENAKGLKNARNMKMFKL